MSSKEYATDGWSLTDLISIERWQRIQDHFSSVLGISLRTIDSKKSLIVSPSWPSGFAHEKTCSVMNMGSELERLLGSENPPDSITTTTCPSGAFYSAIPLRANPEKALAYLVLGPVILGKREDPEVFKRRMSEQGYDGESLWSVLLTLKLYSFAGMKSILELIEDVTSTMLQLGYQSKLLKLLISDSPKVKQAIRRHYMERLFQSLLDVATSATNADGGSVMVYDDMHKALHIAASQGLSEEVVSSTWIKTGEGIAGNAVNQPDVLLLDEQTSDQRMKSRMKRKDLVSSLVAPIMPDSDNESLGVLNLRTTNPNKRFGKEQVELLKRLTKLADIAIGGIQVASSKDADPASSSEKEILST